MEAAEKIKILLICRDGESCLQYRAQLEGMLAEMVVVESFSDYFSGKNDVPLSGILVDMPTYMRFGEEEKRQINELVEIFPAMRLKCNEQSGEIRTLPFNTAMPGVMGIAEFAAKICSVFLARRVRTHERSSMQLNIMASRMPAAEDESIKAITMNISPGGCFIVCFEPWETGAEGLLIFKDIENLGSIQFRVCWTRSWGEKNMMPGMGVCFTGMTDDQLSELGKLCGFSGKRRGCL